jgi:serine/threonine protein kinase
VARPPDGGEGATASATPPASASLSPPALSPPSLSPPAPSPARATPPGATPPGATSRPVTTPPGPPRLPFRPESLVGTTLDGRYRITAHLASGGMGAVFRAEHVYMRKEFALKVLRPDLTASPDLAERFRRESEIAASLDHENIVRVTDFGRTPEGYLFLAMELLEGHSLFDRMHQTGPMSPAEAVPILLQVCAGLEAAHRRGVVHRDLKPENVFLHAPAGATPVVRILDFGIAKIVGPRNPNTTDIGMVVGTPEYLSPEQAFGQEVDARSDVYALGLVAWRMLAGRAPFQADSPRALVMKQAMQPVPPLEEVRPDLAAFPDLLAAITRACAKDPASRTASAAALATELAHAVGLPTPIPAPTLLALPPHVASTPAGTPVRTTPGPRLATPGAGTAAGGGTPDRAPAGPSGDGSWPLPESVTVSLPTPMPPVKRPARRRWRTWVALAGGLALVAGIAFAAAQLHARGRPVPRAQALIAEDREAEARDLLLAALVDTPGDARLRALLGRAQERLGQVHAALESFDLASQSDPSALDAEAIDAVAAHLAGDRRTADRAARVLERVGARAAPPVTEILPRTTGAQRLRTLELARRIGIEERLDPVAAWAPLLVDGDCDLRRAAARRLGEIGGPAAVPHLRALAERREEQPVLPFLKKEITRAEPVCGAREAEEALKRIQAGSRRP